MLRYLVTGEHMSVFVCLDGLLSSCWFVSLRPGYLTPRIPLFFSSNLATSRCMSNLRPHSIDAARRTTTAHTLLSQNHQGRCHTIGTVTSRTPYRLYSV